MVQVRSVLKVIDNTGVVVGQCFKGLGHTGKRIVCLNELLMASVKWINIRKFKYLKERKQRKYNRGTMHRGLLVRTRSRYKRWVGVVIKFNENAIMLVNKRVAPASKRVKGPILNETCFAWPWVGCIIRNVL